MMKKSTIGPIIFIILCISSFGLIANLPKVMILHSYTDSYSWTNSINKFLTKELNDRQYLKYDFYYMDSKQRYDSKIEKRTMKAVRDYNPELIIAFDDNAQKFISKNFDKIPSKTKIIFAGVNGYVDKYNYKDKKNVTGVFEHKPVDGLLYIISIINKQNNTQDYKNITLLSDNSNSAQIDKEILLQESWQDFNFSVKNVSTFKQWQDFILSIDKEETNYLLISGYRKLADENGNYVDYKEVVKWTNENSPIKIIGLNFFAAMDGFALSIGSSPAEQVSLALNMMDKILKDNISPSDIPYETPSTYSIAINDKVAKRLKYKIPLILKSFAKESNNFF